MSSKQPNATPSLLEEEVRRLFDEAIKLEETLEAISQDSTVTSEKTLLFNKEIQKGKLTATDALQKSMQSAFLMAINPIAGTIANVCIELYRGNFMTDVQRKEFAEIGSQITAVPFQMISGKMSLGEGMLAIAGGLKKLAHFFVKNPEIILKVGATILQSLHPLGPFIRMAVDVLMETKIAQNLKAKLVKGLSALVKGTGQLEKVLEPALEHTAKPAKP